MMTEAQARQLIETDGHGNIRIKPGYEAAMANYLADKNIGDGYEQEIAQKIGRVPNALRRTLLDIEATEGIDGLLDYMVNMLHWQLPGVKLADNDKQLQQYRNAKQSEAMVAHLEEHGMPTDEQMEAAGYVWDDEKEEWTHVDDDMPLIKGYRETNDPSGVPQNDPVALIEASNAIIAREYGLDEDDIDEMLPSPDEVLGK